MRAAGLTAAAAAQEIDGGAEVLEQRVGGGLDAVYAGDRIEDDLLLLLLVAGGLGGEGDDAEVEQAAGLGQLDGGVVHDVVFGPAIAFGLGGIFVEILKDTVTEMAPLTQATAQRMIASIKGAPLLYGARGRQRADVEALATLLVALGNFAIANAGRFAALDINPIVVKAEGLGAYAVDIAIDV